METAKLLTNKDGQIVVLPTDFHLSGTEVYIKKIGNAVVLLNKENPWQTLVDSLDQFTNDFMEQRDQPSLDQRETMFE